MDAVGERFSRQALVAGWEQPRLTGATAVVLGVGALGNEVAKNLALAGVGRLVLCDPDVVEVGNLSRAALFAPGDVGRPKVAAAADGLRRLAPDTVVETRQADLVRGAGLGELADAAVVLGCLDSRRARLSLLGRCALVEAPLVDGATGPWSGEVRVRVSTGEPCWGCTLTPFDRAESDLPRNCADIQPPGEEPAAIPVSALVAAWQAALALRIVMGLAVEQRLLRLDVPSGSTSPVGVTRDPDCPYHRPLPPVGGSVAVGPGDTVADLLAALPPGARPRGWVPFPTPVDCLRCGTNADYTRVISGHGLPSCHTCGAALRSRATDELAAAPGATRLADLGVAEQEVLPVRVAEGGYRWVRLSG
jgi:molybdopterin/thiamine biosynthesis adenylyltransferase